MSQPRAISIWQPEEREGVLTFVRPRPLALGDHYAIRRTIPAEKEENCQRICFFGESVAAGYLYAPHLTPAQVLADQLHAVSGGKPFEVIDLARTNETLASLADTIEAALQLSPDQLVIFTGNNWNLLETPEFSPYYPSIAGRQQYAAAFREGGIMGPVEAAARQRLEKAGRYLDRIAEIGRAAAIPVILVVPEVNLADWETRQPVMWLPGDRTAQWHALLQQAQLLIQKEQWEAAFSCADQMLELDQGSCPTTFRLLAHVHMAMGHTDQARLACLAEVNSSHYATLCFLSAPQATSMDKEVLRRAGRFHQLSVVDLPAIFAQFSENGLPGRELFLDYCHLTAKGMKVAMTAVAVAVLRHALGEGQDLNWRDLVTRLPDPALAAEVEATTYLGAAVHTAHRLLPVTKGDEVVAHWLKVALATSPGIQMAMQDLATARSAPAPAVLTAAQQRNFNSRYRLLHQHGWRSEQADLALLETMIQVAGDYDPLVAQTIQQALAADRALTQEGLELVYPPRYLWAPLARFFPEVMSLADVTERGTHRSPWPVTEFGFVTERARTARLWISARLPAIDGQNRGRAGPLEVILNGRRLATAKVDEKWRQIALNVPQMALRAGINRLSLSWPTLPPLGDEAREAALSRLEFGREADLHPVFGELFSVRVTLV